MDADEQYSSHTYTLQELTASEQEANKDISCLALQENRNAVMNTLVEGVLSLIEATTDTQKHGNSAKGLEETWQEVMTVCHLLRPPLQSNASSVPTLPSSAQPASVLETSPSSLTADNRYS